MTTQERFLERLESKFDAWLTAFEERPVRTGFVLIVAFLLLRWVWRNFK